MNRMLALCGSSTALLVGLLAAGCSSSSSSTPDAAAPQKDGSSSQKDSSAADAPSGKDTGTTTDAPAKPDAKGTTDGGTPSDASADAPLVFEGGRFRFNPDAACVPITGVNPCDPGFVGCNTECAVPSHECCNGGGPDASDICVGADAACTGEPESCNETRDCAQGSVCCLVATGISSGYTSCVAQGDAAVPSCPKPAGAIAAAQICKTNAECPTGKCSIYNCVGTEIVACENPNVQFCTE